MTIPPAGRVLLMLVAEVCIAKDWDINLTL